MVSGHLPSPRIDADDGEFRLNSTVACDRPSRGKYIRPCRQLRSFSRFLRMLRHMHGVPIAGGGDESGVCKSRGILHNGDNIGISVYVNFSIVVGVKALRDGNLVGQSVQVDQGSSLARSLLHEHSIAIAQFAYGAVAGSSALHNFSVVPGTRDRDERHVGTAILKYVDMIGRAGLIDLGTAAAFLPTLLNMCGISVTRLDDYRRGAAEYAALRYIGGLIGSILPDARSASALENIGSVSGSGLLNIGVSRINESKLNDDGVVVFTDLLDIGAVGPILSALPDACMLIATILNNRRFKIAESMLEEFGAIRAAGLSDGRKISPPSDC